MPTSSHDLRHGRQGGRIVDWVDMAPPIPIGERRRLNLGAWGDLTVTVVAHLPADRLEVRLPAGATLIVRPHHLEPTA